jgi:hypothetical protein
MRRRRLWHVPIGNPADAQVVAKVNQSADGQGTDVDGRAPGNQGAWESTGIVDASKAFGPGAFLINVQAHTLWVEKAPGDDNNGDGQPDFTYKREGGQLALIRIPGGYPPAGTAGRPRGVPDRFYQQYVWDARDPSLQSRLIELGLEPLHPKPEMKV